MTTTLDKFSALAQMMRACAQAMYDDSELNVGGNGVNSFEASRALDAVAEILGIDGPGQILDRMYEEGRSE